MNIIEERSFILMKLIEDLKKRAEKKKEPGGRNTTEQRTQYRPMGVLEFNRNRMIWIIIPKFIYTGGIPCVELPVVYIFAIITSMPID